MRRFFFILMASLAVLLGSLAWYNYTHDELGILNPDFSSRRITAAENFIKTRYILDNPKKYDAFCFGSSRVAVLPLTEIDDGCRWYNMSYQAGTPAEWLETLQYFVKGGVTVKTVLIGLDDVSFRIDPQDHIREFGDKVPYRPHDIETYLRLLFRKPEPPRPADFVYDNGIYFDIYGTGNTPYPWRDEAIEQDPAKHRAKETFLHSAARTENRMEAAMKDIADLCAFAKAHDIRLIFYMNPLWQATYIDNDPAELDTFRRRLVELTDYYDFSGLNEVATDPYNFYEESHFRPLVGRKILQRIFGDAPENPEGFGVHVTKDTVETHIARLAQQQQRWELSHPDVRNEMNYRRQFGAWCPPALRGTVREDVRLYAHFDQVNGAAPKGTAAWPQQGSLKAAGWLLPGTGAPIETAAVLRDADGTSWYMKAGPIPRPDVNRMANLGEDVRTGFQIDARRGDLPSGTYTLSFLARLVDGTLLSSGDVLTLEVP